MTQKLSLKERLAGWIFYLIAGSVPKGDIIENALDSYPDEISESVQELYPYN